MKRRVKTAYFRDTVDFARVIVVALKAQDDVIHHSPETPPCGQLVKRKPFEEMSKIAAFNFGPAELIENQIVVHRVGHCTRPACRGQGAIQFRKSGGPQATSREDPGRIYSPFGFSLGAIRPMLSVTVTIADLFEFERQAPPTERPDDAALGAMVQRQFRFLAQPINVQIGQKEVTVSFKEESPSAREEASRLAAKASKRAAEGNYSKAISVWKRALELQPTLRVARLELAMVLVERGDTDGAKNQLIEVQRLNPQDNRACVVLGNLYIQSENDLL
jgi:hypothetical protein